MDGTVIVNLLQPVVGEQGQARILVRGLNSRWSLNDDKHPLLRAELRPDGLVQTFRDDGWDVFDPSDVLGVEWVSRPGESAGAYL